MASDEAAGIIDLYQRKAADWIESRAGTRPIEKAWLDRFQVRLPPSWHGTVSSTSVTTISA
jgi:hypothetical protein